VRQEAGWVIVPDTPMGLQLDPEKVDACELRLRITEPGEPRCVCGVNRLTWVMPEEGAPHG